MIFLKNIGVECPILMFDEENPTTTIVGKINETFPSDLLLSSLMWLTRQR